MVSEPDPDDFTDDFIDADGIETHYWEHGPEDGQPIIMVHGGGAGADSWGNFKFAIPQLADYGFHVYAMDMVGFGKSATPDPDEFDYTNQARIDQLAGFIDAIDEDQPPSLIGNSMGGSASTGVAIQQPEIIDKLILVGGAGYRRDDDEEEEETDADDDEEEESRVASFGGTRDEMYNVIDLLSVTDWYDRDAMVDHRMSNYERVEEAWRATMEVAVTDDMSYPDEEWETIESETLLIYGRNDELMEPRVPWGIFNLVEDSSLHILNNCGHWVMVDQLHQSAATIAKFLENA